MSNKSESINTGLNIHESFQKQLPHFYVACEGQQAPHPQLVKINTALAQQLGINTEQLNAEELAQLFSGSKQAKTAKPIAQIYAGHQFGSFNPQLGDGRAILMAEVLDDKEQRWDIHLKGSGTTPFSRGGDGKAGIGPVLREYIMGEAMHALSVPATRGLAVTLTGETIMRQTRQDGAVLARVASSHIRVGTFQYFAARGQQDQVKSLADYTINRHFPELSQSEQPYLALLKSVSDRQAQLIAQWNAIGFVHGVMNTDNVAISGETIDFGPCAFIDQYDSKAVYSSIDRNGRYALGNQAPIAQWNMARFAETLLPLIHENQDQAIDIATQEIEKFAAIYQDYWLNLMNQKIGLSTQQSSDVDLINQLLELMHIQKIDFTSFFHELSNGIEGHFGIIETYFTENNAGKNWLKLWQQRLTQESTTDQQKYDLMRSVNPVYIPRNHLVEEAIEAAENQQDFEPFEQLLTVLNQPFTERSELQRYAQPAPKTFGPYQTFCGT